MITNNSVIKKINKIRQLDDLVALNHFVDYLIFREQDKKTELGQSLIKGLEDILYGKSYAIKSAQDILKIADEL